MSDKVTETFFLPDEIGREHTRVPAEIYNVSHQLLTRSEYDCVFVPIRALQVFGVVTANEIAFVDSFSYAHVDNVGGRIIMLTWRFTNTQARSALDEPVECDVIFHHENGRTIQSRLITEFRDALTVLDSQYREESMPGESACIIRLKPDEN